MALETIRSVVVESSSSAIVETRQWLLANLKKYSFCEDDIFAVHLAFEEAFFNAMQHGNGRNPEKKVKIDCVINSDKVEISMTDDGSGFDPNSVPDCRSGENLYKTEGRGLLLMRSYMNVVEFNERGNSVHMIRYKQHN